MGGGFGTSSVMSSGFRTSSVMGSGFVIAFWHVSLLVVI
jgi:hypothetical protein